MDALQHTATHTPQPTAMPMPLLQALPVHILHWYKWFIYIIYLHMTDRWYQCVQFLFCFCHLPSPQSWVLVLGPWIHLSQPLPLTSGHQSSSMGLGLVREPVRHWPAATVSPKMQGHLQCIVLHLPPPRLSMSRLSKWRMALWLPSTVSLSQMRNPMQTFKTQSLNMLFAIVIDNNARHYSALYLSSFSSVEIKLQPEPSAVLSHLTQRQQQSSILPTTEPLGLSQSHAPQVPTPPGRTVQHYCSIPLEVLKSA